jgi:hypothetical protein
MKPAQTYFGIKPGNLPMSGEAVRFWMEEAIHFLTEKNCQIIHVARYYEPVSDKTIMLAEGWNAPQDFYPQPDMGPLIKQAKGDLR